MSCVVLYERRPLYRSGLVALLSEEGGVDEVLVALDLQDLVDVVGRRKPEFVIVDADAGPPDPAELAATLAASSARTLLMGLTRERSADHPSDWLPVDRRNGIGELLQAIKGVAPPELHVEEHEDDRTLTARESAVLTLIATGLTSREIAERLTVAPKAVDHVKRRIFAKLGVQSQAHAVAVALRDGVLDLRTNVPRELEPTGSHG